MELSNYQALVDTTIGSTQFNHCLVGCVPILLILSRSLHSGQEK